MPSLVDVVQILAWVGQLGQQTDREPFANQLWFVWLLRRGAAVFLAIVVNIATGYLPEIDILLPLVASIAISVTVTSDIKPKCQSDIYLKGRQKTWYILGRAKNRFLD